MLEAIKRILGIGSGINFRSIFEEGAAVIDVRTPEEFALGHIRGSINIPIGRLLLNFGKLDKGKPVILCCASGTRSALARNLLLEKGFARVYNGGSWRRLGKALGNL